MRRCDTLAPKVQRELPETLPLPRTMKACYVRCIAAVTPSMSGLSSSDARIGPTDHSGVAACG